MHAALESEIVATQEQVTGALSLSALTRAAIHAKIKLQSQYGDMAPGGICAEDIVHTPDRNAFGSVCDKSRDRSKRHGRKIAPHTHQF